jgi:osmotically inducible protein OsmC
MTTRTATARYQGMGKDGKGLITTQSGVLDATPYGFNTRFGDEKGTNPEELVAAAHASCFTMALSFALARAGFAEGDLETSAAVKLDQVDGGFTVTRSDLTLTATVPGISADQFADIAADAKANCPISKLLNAEISLTHTLAQSSAG